MNSIGNLVARTRAGASPGVPLSSAAYAIVLLVSLASASITAISPIPQDEALEASLQGEPQLEAAPAERPIPDDQGGPASAG